MPIDGVPGGCTQIWVGVAATSPARSLRSGEYRQRYPPSAAIDRMKAVAFSNVTRASLASASSAAETDVADNASTTQAAPRAKNGGLIMMNSEGENRLCSRTNGATECCEWRVRVRPWKATIPLISLPAFGPDEIVIGNPES